MAYVFFNPNPRHKRTTDYGNDGGDMRMWWEEQLHKAQNEAERNRIRRMMSEAGY